MAYQAARGTLVSLLHQVMDPSGTARVSGINSGAFAVTVTDPTGSVVVPLVLVDEIGSTGLYKVKFTPTSNGIWLVEVENPGAPTADGATSDYEIVVTEGAPEVPQASADLTTLARVRAHIWPTQDPTQPTSYDTLLDDLIDEVTARAVEERGSTWIEASYAEYASGNGSDFLPLLRGPLSGVETVHHVAYDDDGAGAREETLTEVEQYEYLEGGRRADNHLGLAYLLRRNGLWVRGYRNYKVVYTAGFSATPANVQLAVTNQVVAEFNRRALHGYQSAQIGDFRATLPSPEQSDMAFSRAIAPYAARLVA